MIIPSAQDVIRATAVEFGEDPEHLAKLEAHLTEHFGWHPVERADEFGLRIIPTGKPWGPRLIAMVRRTMAIVYWDPDLIMTSKTGNTSPVAHPNPYWRTLYMTRGWSRDNQPTHFIRPTKPVY